MKYGHINAGTSTATALAPDSWMHRILTPILRVLRVQPSTERRLTRVETLALGPRKAIHLIECDGRRFLIADGLSAPVALRIDQLEAGR